MDTLVWSEISPLEICDGRSCTAGQVFLPVLLSPLSVSFHRSSIPFFIYMLLLPGGQRNVKTNSALSDIGGCYGQQVLSLVSSTGLKCDLLVVTLSLSKLEAFTCVEFIQIARVLHARHSHVRTDLLASSLPRQFSSYRL